MHIIILDGKEVKVPVEGDKVKGYKCNCGGDSLIYNKEKGIVYCEKCGKESIVTMVYA